MGGLGKQLTQWSQYLNRQVSRQNSGRSQKPHPDQHRSRSPSQKQPRLEISLGQRVEVPASQHGIDPDWVTSQAHSVITTLKQAGFEAYVVGGAVRDLLLGLRPKDFDVATNATPEEVKALFRRAFIIGRRFRIVHVVFARGRAHEVIEVSTFRAHRDVSQAKRIRGNEKTHARALDQVDHAVDTQGRVLRDNVWGSQQEDAVRRDFSVNALYYDPIKGVVVDFHNGLKDIQKRQLRLIGEPTTRYREDPVRILRAVRFAAKLSGLGFRLAPDTEKPLQACKKLLKDIPQSRLFDETLKLFQTGHALASLQTINQLGLSGLGDLIDTVLERAKQPLMQMALHDTDARLAQDRPVVPSFFLACLFWQDVLPRWAERVSQGEHKIPALHLAMDDVLEAQIGDISGRGKLAADMREIWSLQVRFERRIPRLAHTLVEQPRFRAALDFLKLRGRSGEISEELGTWWDDFFSGTEEVRTQLLEQVVPPAQTTSRRRRTRSEKPSTSQLSESSQSSQLFL